MFAKHLGTEKKIAGLKKDSFKTLVYKNVEVKVYNILNGR